MRADRLVATLLLIQSRGRVTAAEVATELEVSVATARRDLEALAAAGIPVYPQPGRGGGWSLVGGARTDLTGLSAPEANALFTLVGPGAAVTPDAKAALRKLVQALPETFRAAAEAAAGSIVIDPGRWGDVHDDRPDDVRLLQDAVVRQRKVRLRYLDRTGQGSERVVDPWGLVDKDGVWYLVAGTDAGRRTFRVDRIAGAEVLADAAPRPADFDLADAWAEVVEQIERRRSLVAATVTIPTSLLPVLRDHFGRHLEVTGAKGRRTIARVAAHTHRSIAEQLAGWGTTVDVLGPNAVKDELARIGHELAERYGPVPARPSRQRPSSTSSLA